MLAWYSVIAITPSLARSSFLKLASARARASSILVVNVISYSADGRRCIRRPSSGSPHFIYADSFEFQSPRDWLDGSLRAYGDSRCCRQSDDSRAAAPPPLRFAMNSSATEQRPNIIFPPSVQPSAPVLQSWNTTKLAFFGDTLVRFIGALYSILVVLALERQKLCHLKDAICAATIERPRGEAHRLAYLEFVILHRALHPIHMVRSIHMA
jgi:hypothetical protein